MIDVACHYLKENRASHLPYRVLYLDTETKTKDLSDRTLHRMKIAWTCYVSYKHRSKQPREVWKQFETTLGLCSYLRDLSFNKDPLFVFGHNIFFDLQSSDFFYYFSRWKWTLSFIYDKGLTYILVIRKDKQTLKFISSTNYYDASLEKLGEMVGIPKGNPDFSTVSDSDLSEYCRNDVLILKTAMERYFSFIRDNDLGSFGLTRAAQSYNAYRHRFMRSKIGIHNDPDIKDLERSAYFGGRTECFRFGEMPEADYVTLDINSMYPYVMKYYPMPTRCIDFLPAGNPESVFNFLDTFCYIAEVLIDTDEPAYPYRMNGRTVFPVGRFPTFVCTEGLRYAIEHNHLVKIGRIAVYEQHYIFGDYVDFFYRVKEQAAKTEDRTFYLLAKKFMNSLYGRFGMKRREEMRSYDFDGNYYYRIETMDPYGNTVEIQYKLINTVIIQGKEVETNKTFVPIPAHVTEYARFLLWEIIKQVGIDRVFYCDTDSIKILAEDLEKVRYPLDQYKIGSLSIEDRFTRFRINGNKHYETDKQRKIRGVPRRAREITPYMFEYDEFLRQYSHLREGSTRVFIVKKTQKYAPPYYDKGIVQDDGHVTPFRLSIPEIPSSLPLLSE